MLLLTKDDYFILGKVLIGNVKKTKRKTRDLGPKAQPTREATWTNSSELDK